MKKWVIRIGANYFIVPLCGIMYLTAGAVFFLFLPFLQLFFCFLIYKWSHDLKSWLLLQINMLIAAMFGNYTGARLFLSFISNDAESQIIFTFIFQVDMWIVLLLSLVSGGAKMISCKRGKKRLKEQRESF